MDPLISVMMPLRYSTGIIEVGIRSLCDQLHAPPWELLILDDEEGAVTTAPFNKNASLLNHAGCINFHYKQIAPGTLWARKLWLAAQMVHANSRVVVFQPDDDYFYNNRLRQALTVYDEQGYTHLSDRWGHFVQVETGKALLFDQARYGRPYGLLGCFNADTFRKMSKPPQEYDAPDEYLHKANMAVAGLDAKALVLDNDDWRRAVNLNFPRNKGTNRDKAFSRTNERGPCRRVKLSTVWMPEFIRDMVGRDACTNGND